jgi:hypothetical protein
MVLNHARLPFRHFGTYRAIFPARPSSPYRPDWLTNLARTFWESKSFLNKLKKTLPSRLNHDAGEVVYTD